MFRVRHARLLPTLLLFIAALAPVSAELPVDSYELRRSRAYALTDQHSPEAEKALLRLLAERPNDGGVLFALGRASYAAAGQLKAGKERRKLQKQTRDYFTRAQAAGFNDPLIGTVLASINADGTEKVPTLSQHPEVDQLLKEGDKLFSAHDFPAAIEKYRRAAALEPENYLATLYVGDANFASGNQTEALVWFDKAAALDPNRELAFRYAGDALGKSGKREEALQRYLSAAIAEPYNGYPWRALNQYCQANLIKAWTAPANVPTADIRMNGKKAELVLPKDFTPFDIVYGTARIKWQEENRSKRFPDDSQYRLTLEEEVSALRTMLAVYTELKSAKNPPPPDLAATLEKYRLFLEQPIEVNQAGMLEAHALLVRGNASIAQDYAAYRDAHRDLLRNYLTRFYLHLP